jgi:hypothetical protein
VGVKESRSEREYLSEGGERERGEREREREGEREMPAR